MRILLVDDEENFLELTKLSLEEENPQFQVDISPSAEKALDLLEERDYDAIVSDYQMPVMDGVEFLRIIREEREDDIPFIMFTGKGREDVAVKALNLGADQYIQKGGDQRSQYGMLARMIVQEVKHRRARKALWESEEKYRTLIDDVIDELDVGVFILDSEFKVVWINNTMCQYFGLDRDKIIGKDKRQLIHGKIGRIFESPDEFMEKVLTTYDDNTYMENFECHVLPEGERKERYLIHKSQPILSGLLSGGRVENYYDITERKQVEHALWESEERFRELFENMSSGVAVYEVVDDGETFIFKDFNEAAEKIEDVKREDIIGRSVSEVFPGVKEFGLLEVFRRVWRTGEPEYHPISIYKDERIEGWRENRVHKLPSGEIVAVYNDVTERKKTEEILKRESEERRILLDNVETMIWYAMDPETYGAVNRARAEFLGMRKEELEGRRLHEILNEDEAEICVAGNMEAFRGKKVQKEEWARTASGDLRCIFVTKIPKLDENGDVEYVICTGHDITERKQAEIKVEHLNEVLRSIRNVNQLITKETDRESLIQRSCKLLTEGRGYLNAWITLFDEGQYVSSANSGLDEKFEPMRELLETGNLTSCGKEAMERPGVRVTENPLEECVDCPLHTSYEGRSGYTIRLSYLDKVYGLLLASIPINLADELEEQSLFEEIADDIGFALNRIELETERKKAEEKLRESGRFMTNIMESAPIPMLVINRDTSIRYVNPAMERLTDFSSEELVGEKTPYPWWTEETLKETDRDFKIAMREGPVRLEELFKKKNGERFWVEITALPVYNGPKFEYFLANWVDITERKKSEEKIKKSEKEYRELVEGVSSIVMRLDTEGNIKFMNEYGRRFFGYSKEELLGKKVFGTIVPERDSEGIDRWGMVEDVLKHPDEYSTYEVENIRKDGGSVWISWTNGTIRDRGGSLSEILFIGNDVTELKRAEDRVEFLYSLLRHDVRNKEAVTQGNLELLKETDLSEKQLRYVEKAMRGSVEGAEIIEKVEMLQKVGKEKVEDFNLASVIKDVIVEYKPQSSERGIEIECPMNECSVRGGPLLRELFRNLIDNSIKHSGGDRIRVSGGELDDEVRCTIEDNGRGIPKDIWDKVFHRGFKSGETGGTGIGLFIVMEIAKGYGGRVEVRESELGGARFDVHLQRS